MTEESPASSDGRPIVVFLPGNGHVEDRLRGARLAVESGPAADAFELKSVAYDTGLDTFEELLQSVAVKIEGASLVYATGIGGLVALALRARGGVQVPIVLQGPVLWGLETRRFPKVMRLPGMPKLLVFMLKRRFMQRRFEHKHFEKPLDDSLRRAFFGGYGDAAAFARWFRWLTPALLRELEPKLLGRADLIDGCRVWWGDQDHVVALEELRLTERRLSLTFPLRRFPAWGHYPMVDEPVDWAAEVARVLATTR